jgi:outer membrane protein assembly factor BamA
MVFFALPTIAQHQVKLILKDQFKKGTQSFTSASSNDVNSDLRKWQLEKIDSGYLATSIDSIRHLDSTTIAYVYLGKRYQISDLQLENLPAEIPIDQPKSKINRLVLSELLRDVITSYANNGYPFAKAKFKPIELEQNQLKLSLEIDQGTFFKMDTIGIKGSGNLTKNFLYNYLGFRPGDAYNESLVKTFDQKLNNLNLIKVNKATRIYFVYKSVLTHVYIDDRKSDRFDGIVGLAPASENAIDQGLLLTGEVHLAVNNLMQSGKELGIDWRNFLVNSQELKSRIALPYLFNTAIGVNGQFDLLKFDTSFVKTSVLIGTEFRKSGNNSFSVFYNRKSTSLISADTNLIRSSQRLPSTNAVSTDLYGFTTRYEKLDYGFNPRKGFQFAVKAALGIRNIQRDARIDLVKFRQSDESLISVYDTMELTSLQSEISHQIRTFIPLFKKSTIAIRIDGHYLFNDVIYFNELSQFGGNASLRGFDEQSLFASSFTMINLEYRYLYSKNSYVHAFLNGAYMENQSIENIGLQYSWPIGFGLGANIELPTGQLTLAYALGKIGNNPIAFTSAKIHFGIINYF